MTYAKRRYYKRRNNQLSTKRIFNNKGAKAQAKQIYALKKQVRRINKRFKPETKVVESAANIQNYGFGYFGTPGQIQDQTIDMPLPAIGAGDNNRIGNLVTMVGPKVYLNAAYTEFYNTLKTGFSVNKIPLSSSGITFRLFAIQLKQASGTWPTYDALLDVGPMNNDPIKASGLMTCPFKAGITAKYNIVYNKTFTVSAVKPELNKVIKLRPKWKNIQWDTSNQALIPKGAIRWYIVSAGWSQNVYTPAQQDPIKDFNSLNFSFSTKTPFVDP